MKCKICGTYACREHSLSLGTPRSLKTFSGSSPPEVFVGRWNYPNVYTGILASQEEGNTELLSSHEQWHAQRLSIPEITNLRKRLIYGRKQQSIHTAREKNKFTEVMQEVAMTHKSVATEFRLKNRLTKHTEQHTSTPLIARTAYVDRVTLQENAQVKPKIDYLVNDKDAKSAVALQELHKGGIQTSSLIKLLSAGLLGRGTARKLVPTRWAITAVDDTLSKRTLEKIKNYKELNEIRLFTADYLGNHYEVLLLPGPYAFEVIEKAQTTQVVWHDYESNFPRKNYADSVTGAYYANRLALTEYLEKIQRQASCLILREIGPEYTTSCGVGILRELTREAFTLPHTTHTTKEEALETMRKRIQTPLEGFTSRSKILKNYEIQKKIVDFLK